MIKPVHDENGVTLYHSNSIFAMMGMPDNSVDSIVTDPPYGLSFMGKKWDYEVPSVQLWQEALRVLKPGGHLLSFAGSRTYHRMAVNIEDAGFEIRDQIMWIYGSGFPKSLDIGKAIDKAAGAEREVVGMSPHYSEGRNHDNFGVAGEGITEQCDRSITAPATDAAKQWDGWGTALKPAHEPIVVARKPLIGTVAENVLKYGTGGINIDGGRIGTEDNLNGGTYSNNSDLISNPNEIFGERKKVKTDFIQPKGRFPANIIFDPEAAEILDKQSGDSMSNINKPCEYNGLSGFNGALGGDRPERGHNDSGGASRFFYCAKASKADRDEGLESNGCTHPTVKPTALMQYLVRLVTPPGGTTFDPFTGSGSTGKAAVREGFKFIGSERDAEYIPIIIARINAPAQVELL